MNSSFYKSFILLILFKISIFLIWYNDIHKPREYLKRNSLNVVYVNLDKNENRAKHMDKILNFVGINEYRRFRAVDAVQLYNNKSYLNSFDQAKSIKFNLELNRNDKPARAATWLSYLFLFKHLAASSSDRPILIFEDDIDIERDFVKLLENSMKEAPNDWDILLCGHCCLEYFPYNYKKVISKLWTAVKHFSALHCFVVRNSTVARQIVNRIDLEVVVEPVDIAMAGMGKFNQLAIYAHATQLAIQRRDLFGTNNPDSGQIAQEKLMNSSILFLENFP